MRENKTPGKARSHYVSIDEGLCNGCVLCMRACPTKAIRVRGGKARIEGDCIECGACLRMCPRGAVRAITTGSDAFREKRYTMVSASPVIYCQFGEDVMPNDILLALRKVFSYVYDQSYTQELFNVAAALYIKEHRRRPNAPHPLISPVCPVVNRLIAYRFPSLLKHILPILNPRELAARELKKRHGAGGEEIGVYYVTPCAAKMISIKDPILLESSHIDGVVGINEVFDIIKGSLAELEEDVVLHHSSGVGIGWGMSGGEAMGLGLRNYLAVSGIEEINRYLEKIEMGLFEEVEYFEFRACREGCIGGPMTVADTYQAKRTLQKLVRMFGVEKRVKYAYVRKLYREGWFFNPSRRDPGQEAVAARSIPEAIKRQEEVDRILRLLPRRECGACGSPDCRTFAGDVVDGKVSLANCVFREGGKGKGEWQ